jgi:hypothetical protein
VVSYSPSAARALGFLKRYYNDIEIFVEDSSCHNMSLAVFRRILGPTVRLTSVNQLGGRDAVLKACRLDQANDQRKKLYIIDGDLDLLLGRRKPKLRHLYRLRAYCVENLILTEEAVLHVCMMSMTNMKPQDLALRLDFHAWLEDIERKLTGLFHVYAVAHEADSSIATVSFPVKTLCTETPQGAILAWEKITARARAVYRALMRVLPVRAARASRLNMVSHMRTSGLPDWYFISGKDYIFPILYLRLRRLFRYRGQMEQLKVQMAMVYDADMDPFLTRRLRTIARR